LNKMKKNKLKHKLPVLVVEDNPVSRKFLEKILIKAGHEVVSVDNGRKALKLFKDRFFPIVFTDWMMPEMDGLELCRAIRKNQSTGYVFIILLTAKDSTDDIVTGLEAGADDYLIKPPNHAELIARLNTGIRILDLERSLITANEEIKTLSITDSLTGSYNRGYLTERFVQEISRAKRYRRMLSLVLCDIDHFKRVNDTYGHLAGDQVLKEFVQRINRSIRNNVDWVVRYGGEEFLIVLPETNLSGAYTMAERLRNAISQMVFEVQGQEICITASFGVTNYDPTSHDKKISPETMISRVDSCLYQAKEDGRNKIIAGQPQKSCLNQKDEHFLFTVPSVHPEIR